MSEFRSTVLRIPDVATADCSVTDEHEQLGKIPYEPHDRNLIKRPGAATSWSLPERGPRRPPGTHPF